MYPSYAVQFHPGAGQSDFVSLATRTPHRGASYVRRAWPDEIKKNTKLNFFTAFVTGQWSNGYVEQETAGGCSGQNEICSYNTGACASANTLPACKALCDADSTCVSLEYDSNANYCQLSDSCT